MVIQNVALMAFGPDPQSMPPAAEGVVTLGKIVMPLSRLYVVAFSAVVLVALYVFLMHSRSEEHTSELQSLMRISYAVFCLKKKKAKLTQYYAQTRRYYSINHTSCNKFN